MSTNFNNELDKLKNKNLEVLNTLEENIYLKVDLNQIIDEGIEIREKNLLRKNVITFIIAALFIAIGFVVIYLKFSIKVAILTQIVLTMATLILILILNKILGSREISQ